MKNADAGETPYECRICHLSFRTHHIYSGHGKTVHQESDIEHRTENWIIFTLGKSSSMNIKNDNLIYFVLSCFFPGSICTTLPATARGGGSNKRRADFIAELVKSSGGRKPF